MQPLKVIEIRWLRWGRCARCVATMHAVAREITGQIPSERIEQIQFGRVHFQRLGVEQARRAGISACPTPSGVPANPRTTESPDGAASSSAG